MKSLLLSLISMLLPFLKPFVEQMLKSAGQALASAALSAVKWVKDNKDYLSNEEKRNEAMKVIRNQLAYEGIDIATSTINAAIEAAVVKLKSAEK